MNLDSFGMSWQDAITVAATAVGLYLLFLVLVRLLGQRILTSRSSLDVMLVITLGAVLGRAILGASTDLMGGAVAVLSLLLIQAVFSRLRRWRPTEHLVRLRPVVLIWNGTILEDHVQRTRLDDADLWARMRLVGVGSPDEVALMTMESTGEISVLRRGEPIDERVLAGLDLPDR